MPDPTLYEYAACVLATELDDIMESSEQAPERPAFLERDEAYRMAALASDYTPNFGSCEG